MRPVFRTLFAIAGVLAARHALAQEHPALGKTIDCGGTKAVIAKNGDVTLQPALAGTTKGKLKIVPNVAGFKNVKDLQVLDAKGQMLVHFQEEKGQYSLEGDRCRLR